MEKWGGNCSQLIKNWLYKQCCICAYMESLNWQSRSICVHICSFEIISVPFKNGMWNVNRFYLFIICLIVLLLFRFHTVFLYFIIFLFGMKTFGWSQILIIDTFQRRREKILWRHLFRKYNYFLLQNSRLLYFPKEFSF